MSTTPELERGGMGGRRRVASRDALKTSFSMPFTHGQKPSISSISPTEPYSPDIDYMMEPAVDGPPSPERLRQLSKQMKRASHINRGQGHRAASSGSSPRPAIGVDRPQWESSFDNTSLTRRSSTRSTDSSAPSQGRLERESVQVLGRNFFQRTTNKAAKRATSPYSTSSGSMYSTENLTDSGFKDSIIPNIFARRKQSRDDAMVQKKLQISGPFNFQHVSHTNRNDLPSAPHPELRSEPSIVSLPTDVGSPGLLSDGSEQDLTLQNAPSPTYRRVLKTAKSQDQLRSAPLVSPGSTSPIFTGNISPPVPPRMSSRQSLLPEPFGTSPVPSFERPRTMLHTGNFRQPQPYSPSLVGEQTSPPATSPVGTTANETDYFPDNRFSHAITTNEAAAWPLPTGSPLPYDQVLPDVPEEEEHQNERSRLSITSKASLRGSHSVPILRSSLSARPASAASDTLGPFDVVAAERALDSGSEQTQEEHTAHPSPADDNWEDVIDYCYEHEAEANFDYQWERPSMDVSRDHVPSPQAATRTAPALSIASPIEEASLSFSSRASSATSQRGTTSNFSLPRGEKGSRMWQMNSIRPVSYSSTYKESQGFNLSPSLLIPGDYHHQMMAESERYDYSGDNEYDDMYQRPYHEEMVSHMDQKPLHSYLQRSSTSTTETAASSITDTTGERHVSANSTFTTMTHLTLSSSTTSLNKVASASAELEQPSPLEVEAEEPEASDSKDLVADLTPFPVPPSVRKPFHKSHASESVVRDERTALQTQELNKNRRPRARTSSLGTQMSPSPVNYALFPRGATKGAGERI